MIKPSSHSFNILKMLYKGLKLTATDLKVSNANQYFCELEKLGLIKSEWGIKGKSKVKFRFVDPKQKVKVKSFFDSYSKPAKNENSKKDEKTHESL